MLRFVRGATRFFSDRSPHRLVRHVYTEERKHWRYRRCFEVMQVWLGLSVALLTVFLIVSCSSVQARYFLLRWVGKPPGDSTDCTLEVDTLEMVVNLIALPIFAVCPLILLLFYSTSTSRWCGGLMATIWASNFMHTAAVLGHCDHRSEVLAVLTILSWACATFYSLYFARECLVRGSTIPDLVTVMRFLMRGWRLCACAGVIALCFAGDVATDAQIMKGRVGFEVVVFLSSYVIILLWPAVMFASVKSCMTMCHKLTELTPVRSSSQLAEVQYFSRRIVLGGCQLGSLVVTQLATWMYRLARLGVLWPVPQRTISLKWHWIVIVDSVLHVIIFNRERLSRFSAERKMQSTSAERRKRWFTASASWRPNKHEAWQAKIAELAGRGFTLEALLGFYRGLGSTYMPQYVAARHRTLDVVRMAIIPESRHAKSALADIMMGGAYTRPQTLVTHNWDNLFRDLVAAVVADALGDDDFACIAYLLEHDIEIVAQAVRAAGVQQNTYWICAFSVNQHRGICSDNPEGTRDPVSMELHPTCSCGSPKAWNDTAPTLTCGRGIECEMNKFDDMVRYLSASDAKFRQLIVIDSAFCIFSRAWCVAEIVVSKHIGMQQSFKIKSQAVLAFHENSLKRLKVEEMSASRPEDKQHILDSIQDTAAFNRHLQDMLFYEMFPSLQKTAEDLMLARFKQLLRWSSVRGSRASLRNHPGAVAFDFDLDLENLIGRPQGLDVCV
eukprot:TRINITY_DN4864_c0_g1_i7.p1 TRINITY_DN4864_c0_g1~~TRINITY_DN4864_c0_g1_i7.p1  ORF type:complete len:727 (-),score=51.53 TRINITY_DN4864_c0_g1_i7:88-2268(-)